MTSKLTLLVTGLVAASSIAVSANVLAKHHSQRHDHSSMRAIFESLDLTDNQRIQLREIIFANKGRDRGKARLEMMKAVLPLAFTEELNSTQINLTLDALLAVRKAKGLAMAEHRHEVSQILTAEQIAQVEVILDTHDITEKEQPDFERLLQRLEITPQQEEAFMLAVDEVDAARIEMKAHSSAFRTAQRNIILAEDFDESAWLAQFEMHALSFRTSGNALIESLHNLYTVLDENQQSELKRLLKNRFQQSRRSA